jgi:hypothetical protein
MAESQEPARGLSMEEIAAGLKLGQSKSTGDVFVGFSDLESPQEGKNRMVLVCQHCKCRVIRPGYATLVDREVCYEHRLLCAVLLCDSIGVTCDHTHHRVFTVGVALL